VGHYAIELAKWAGARVVTTVSGPQKASLAQQAGADLVVNYLDNDAIGQIKAFAPVTDRVVEVALGANLALDLAVAGPSTVVVSYAADGADRDRGASVTPCPPPKCPSMTGSVITIRVVAERTGGSPPRCRQRWVTHHLW
jgi:NADPH:quinone reductase-like Zn-dependent oxidoreductase